MSIFTKDSGRITEVNASKLTLLKRADTGAFVNNPVGLANPDGSSLKVEYADTTAAPLYCATPSGPLAAGTQTQVPTREYVDGDITTVMWDFDFAAINGLGYAASGAGDWAGTFNSTYVVPQDSYVHETFVWSRDVWNGSPAAPGPIPPTIAGVYVSVGSSASGPTAPFTADFNRFGEYFMLNTSAPKVPEAITYWDRLSSATPIFFNVYIPNGTAKPLTIGHATVVVKIVKAPRL